MISLSEMQGGRSERRMTTNIVVDIASTVEPEKSQTALIVNLSEHGARIVTQRQWETGNRVLVNDPHQVFWAIGEVVYCQPFSVAQFAIGLKFNDTLGVNVLIRPATESLETQRQLAMLRGLRNSEGHGFNFQK